MFYPTVTVNERKRIARAMATEQSVPISCLPTTNGKMSKVKRAIEEAKQLQNPELDLVDKNVVSFEEIPGICK